MKNQRRYTLHLSKKTISKLDVKKAMQVMGGATQSQNQMTGCNTNCTATNGTVQ